MRRRMLFCAFRRSRCVKNCTGISARGSRGGGITSSKYRWTSFIIGELHVAARVPCRVRGDAAIGVQLCARSLVLLAILASRPEAVSTKGIDGSVRMGLSGTGDRRMNDELLVDARMRMLCMLSGPTIHELRGAANVLALHLQLLA